MKNIITVIFVLVVSSLSFAQDAAKNKLHGYVEQESEVINGKFTPQVKTYITYGGKQKVGLYCWAQSSRVYSEFYCGPTYSPKTWLQVGGAVGYQTTKEVQTAGFVWIGKGKFSNLFLIEKSGVWFRNRASYEAGKKITLSVVSQRFRGTGPRIDWKATKAVSLGVESRFGKSPSIAFGLRYSF